MHVVLVELGKDKRLLVLRELIVNVLLAYRDQLIKIQHHIPVLLVKVVLPLVVVVKDL